MIYLKIEINRNIELNPSLIVDLITKMLFFILPVANPDFSKKINNVKFWYLEFDNINDPPGREIGFDLHNNIIMKMPYRNNYGYWVDNNLTYNDFFEHFKCNEITGEEFNLSWDKFNME